MTCKREYPQNAPCRDERAGACNIFPKASHTVPEGGRMQSKNAEELAWELFERTGNVTYYMLYKQLHFEKKG